MSKSEAKALISMRLQVELSASLSIDIYPATLGSGYFGHRVLTQSDGSQVEQSISLPTVEDVEAWIDADAYGARIRKTYQRSALTNP